MRLSFLSLVTVSCLMALSCAGPLIDSAASPMRARVSNRKENSLNSAMYGRASLLFRAMDKDHDKLISAEDVRSSPELLKQHLPQVSEPEFLAFMEVADTDGDKKLDLEELLKGLSDGLQEAKKNNMIPAQSATKPVAPHQTPSEPNLLETGANIHSQAQAQAKAYNQLNRRHRDTETVGGGAMDARFMQQQRDFGLESDEVKGGDDDCVMCQYIIERCEANIRQSGVLPGFSSVAAFDSYLELEQTITPQGETEGNSDVSLLEVQSTASATASAKQLYFDQTAAGIIGSTRQSTRVQRQLERQKYNEVYRVTDLSLDDVCEQGMPIKFYGICKKIYKLQSDVVDGLRYQYRPADICFRVGLCPKGSYITTGVHSRYKGV